MGIIDEKAVQAAEDDRFFSEFVDEMNHFIIHCAYQTCHKYIDKSDDEWSVALIAFSNAVKKYDPDKGSFIPFAELAIRRSLIDHYRSERKRDPELSVDPVVFGAEHEEDVSPGIRIELSEKLSVQKDTSIKYEIEAANSEFNKFGFSFFNLASCSPKTEKTRNACKKAVLYILESTIIRNELESTCKLPIKNICKTTDLPRKLLEHHRRYIIAAVVILSGEYPALAEYMSFIRKGGH